MSKTNKSAVRQKRKARIRKKISGTAARPRLTILRSARHVYAQVIDDETSKTIVSVHSYKKGSEDRANIAKCSELGKTLAEKCKASNIGTVVFDKNGYAYHGRVKAFADGAREGGLNF